MCIARISLSSIWPIWPCVVVGGEAALGQQVECAQPQTAPHRSWHSSMTSSMLRGRKESGASGAWLLTGSPSSRPQLEIAPVEAAGGGTPAQGLAAAVQPGE